MRHVDLSALDGTAPTVDLDALIRTVKAEALARQHRANAVQMRRAAWSHCAAGSPADILDAIRLARGSFLRAWREQSRVARRLRRELYGFARAARGLAA